MVGRDLFGTSSKHQTSKPYPIMIVTWASEKISVFILAVEFRVQSCNIQDDDVPCLCVFLAVIIMSIYLESKSI